MNRFCRLLLIFIWLFLYENGFCKQTQISEVLFKIEPTIVTLYSKEEERSFSIKRENLVEKSFGKIPVDHFLNGYTEQLLDPNDKYDEEKLAKLKNYLGSGFIIDSAGYILTNYSNIKSDAKVRALINGKEYELDVVGEDRKTNLALLKVKELSNFPAIAIGDSNKLKPGDDAFIISNPFNVGTSATYNTISFRPKSIEAGIWEDFLQLTNYTSIYCSGSPLVNLDGEVIGICDPRLENKNGIGFAIPSSLIKIFIDSVKKDRRLKRINLGLKIKDIDDYDIAKYGLYSSQGAIITAVKPSTPATDLDFREGDIITRFNGNTIKNKHHFEQILATIPIGSRVDIDFIRNSRVRTVVIPIQELQQKANVLAEVVRVKKRDKVKQKTIFGLSLEPISEELIKEYSLVQSVKGLVVTSVLKDSIAEFKGIKAGDLIIKADNKELEKVEDLYSTIAENNKSGKKSILFMIIRKESSFFVVIDLN